MKIFSCLPLLLLTLTLAACAGRPPVPQSAALPFSLERDLVGKTIGKGSFRAINGTTRGFTAYLDGQWDGETLTLKEDFLYDDGEKDQKTWRLTRQSDGTWRGSREDVVGEAIGFQDGEAFRLEYEVVLPDEDGGAGMTVKFRDVLVRETDGTVLNTATVGYWGLRVGTVELQIRRDETGSEGP